MKPELKERILNALKAARIQEPKISSDRHDGHLFYSVSYVPSEFLNNDDTVISVMRKFRIYRRSDCGSGYSLINNRRDLDFRR